MKIARIVALLATFACLGVHAQGRDFSKVEVKAQKLADGVYMLTGAGGNIGVSVGEDGIVLIDDQYAPLTDKIRAALAQLSDKPARFVINTHYHGDHTGGNESFGKAGAVIVAHENVRRRLSEKQFSKLFDRETPPAPPGALPLVTFTRDVKLHFNGEDLEVFHVENAHTDGDSLVFFRKANVIHLGDTYWNAFYPFIDTDGGGSIDGMIRSADRVLAMVNDDTRIVPGHGQLGTRADFVRFREMLVTLRERVAALLRAGKTLDEAIAAAPTKDLDEVWGKGFINPETAVKMVYADLARTVK